MTATLTALHDEHQHLLPHINELSATAALIGTIEPMDMAERLDRAIDFLENHLIPHARAEDDVLYTVVAQLLGDDDATATMKRDHVEVAKLTEELSLMRSRILESGAEDLEHLKQTLYGLHAVISLHFAKEEEVYVPLLEDRLDQNRADAMLRDMHTAHERYSRKAS